MGLHAPLGTTNNYSDIANLHIVQITTAPAKPFPACCVLTSPSLATASNSGDSSSSRAQVPLSQPPVQNSCQLNYSAISSQPPLQSSTYCEPSTNSMNSRLATISQLNTLRVKVRVRVTLRLAVYRQSVRPGAMFLEDHGQRFLLSEPLRS
jgi:hypothetical protein